MPLTDGEKRSIMWVQYAESYPIERSALCYEEYFPQPYYAL